MTAAGPSSHHGQSHGEIFPLPIISSDKLDSLSLPPLQIDPSLLPKQGEEGVEESGDGGEEGQEGFDAIHTYLTNHAHAAAAEAGVEALAEASGQGGQVFGFAMDEGREVEGSPGSSHPQGQGQGQAQGTSGSTTRYLMTLANAAEAASDGPGATQTIANAVLNHERQRAVAALTRASDSLTGDILEEIEGRFSGSREDGGRVGDQFVNAL